MDIEEIEDAEVIIKEPTGAEVDETEVVVEADDDDDPKTEEEVGDIVVTFGDDETPEVDDDTPAPEWVKDLRKRNRELSRENADLKKVTAKVDEKPSPLSAKPTLEQAGYDEEKFAKQLEDWTVEKRTHADAETEKEKEVEAQTTAWNSRLGEYNEGKSSFKPEIIEDAEAVAREAFSVTQQGVLIQVLGKNAAAVLVGLAVNEKQLKTLAAESNPIIFAADVARLESIMKTSTKRPKSTPETRVKGSAPSGGSDRKLEKLEAAAEKSGDRTAVQRYKRELRKAS